MTTKTIHRLFDIPEYQLQHYPRKDALCKKRDTGKWEYYSTEDFVKYINAVSCGLLDLGMKKGETAATYSYNMPEWNFADLGMQQIGVVHVPLYPTMREEDLVYILNEANVKIIFVESKELVERVLKVKSEIPCLRHIFTFNQVAMDGVEHWSAMHRFDSGLNAEVRYLAKEIEPDDVATVVYTSSQSGYLKGVMLTHDNIISNVFSCLRVTPVSQTHRALSFLPLCHAFERMVCYVYMYTGAGIYYVQSTSSIPVDLKEVKPHFFATVPLLLEKVYDNIYRKGQSLPGIPKRIFQWALDLALQYDHTGKNYLYQTQHHLADKLVYSKWRDALGGNVMGIICGGAALQPRLTRIFWAAQIPVLEGYGLTETSPVVTTNRLEPGKCKFGTVGLPVDDVEVKIASDGEILVRGPNVMKGYYNHPELMAEVFDEDGFYRTGDLGKLDEEGFLKITGIKKEFFKTSGGKYVSPQKLENKLRESPFIRQVMITGENQKYPVALIVPEIKRLQKWSRKNNITEKQTEQLLKNKQIHSLIWNEIEKLNEEVASHEKVRNFAMLPDEWNTNDGTLTHTQKLNRKKILEKYIDVIKSLYKDRKAPQKAEQEVVEVKEAVKVEEAVENVPEHFMKTGVPYVVAAIGAMTFVTLYAVGVNRGRVLPVLQARRSNWPYLERMLNG